MTQLPHFVIPAVALLISCALIEADDSSTSTIASTETTEINFTSHINTSTDSSSSKTSSSHDIDTSTTTNTATTANTATTSSNEFTCGDGTVDDGEECDDGNQDQTDDCLNNCTIPICGDGNTWLGHETCDEGENNGSGWCYADCHFCGDSILNDNTTEECDDGNKTDDDVCDNNCQINCGNGDIESPEECDDGYANGDDARCSSDCKKRWLHVFISSEDYNGNLGGLSGADEKCTTLANNFDQRGVYRAWISQTTKDTNDKVTPLSRIGNCSLPYHSTNGDIITPNMASLITTGPDIFIVHDEKKSEQIDKLVWTQTLGNGDVKPTKLNWNKTKLVEECGDWSFDYPLGQTTSLTIAGIGWAKTVDIVLDNEDNHNQWDNPNDWTEQTTLGCAEKAHIYCFEQCPTP